eukprot:CAMPEP_0203669696 /NCGR_PEP_ID=MMETSP0090-20130426/5996_1 /ASSEMBLY_ACC=CAM_ASM_001088 /TAXON_ID=426623 /ORGANISM="Chaetoceros affinis, Strain CCMP159" /LENGTH=132 /DNA_ID=CAMNT_0050534427 /DNA_START=158 /DNA_END=552 /DNA_ORIENTATION=-
MDLLLQPFANKPLSPSPSIDYGDAPQGQGQGQGQGQDQQYQDQNQDEHQHDHDHVHQEGMEIETSRPPSPLRMMSAYNDRPSQMTYGRRLALKLARFAWYNPHVKQGDNNDNVNEGEVGGGEVGGEGEGEGG